MIARTRWPRVCLSVRPTKQPRALRVGVRRALAGEVGQEEQPFAAGRRHGGFFGEHVVDVDLAASWPRRSSAWHSALRNHCSEPPAESVTPIMCHLPRTAWQNVCSRPAGSTCGVVAVDEHDAGGADRRRQHAAADDAVAHGAGRAIAGPADHHAIGRQAQRLGRFGGELAGDFFRFVTRGQQTRIELQLAEQLLRPAAIAPRRAAACRWRR